MNKTVRKILIGVLSTVILFVILYIAMVAHFLAGCGFNDGPFHGKLIKPSEISQYAKQFQLNTKQTLIIDNRAEKQSPIITLVDRKGKAEMGV